MAASSFDTAYARKVAQHAISVWAHRKGDPPKSDRLLLEACDALEAERERADKAEQERDVEQLGNTVISTGMHGWQGRAVRAETALRRYSGLQAAAKGDDDLAEFIRDALSGLAEDDLRIEPWGRGDPMMGGGNRNPRGVRITHLPTGIAASCDEEKSQLRNREAALGDLREKLRAAADDTQEHGACS